MQPRDRQHLERIVEYCKRIEATVSRYGNALTSFMGDTDYQQSVSFSLLQIGELVAGLSDKYKASTSGEMPWSAIKAMRNIVVHGYGSINLDTVWETVQSDIPDLKAFCLKALN